LRLLVTGGAGFIGSNFIRYILNRNKEYYVINLDKLSYSGNLENLTDIEASDRYTFIKGDICDPEIFNDLEFDVIVNFAAESHVDRSILDAQPFLKTNIIGTHNLLEVALKRECLFIQISTDEVYGSIEEGSFTEDSPLRPNSPYAASKASADLLIRAYIKTHGIRAIITRCSNNYGPYQFPEKFIPLIIVNALTKKPIPVYGDGMNVRDWIFVEDHCRAIEAIIHKGMPGNIYNIGARQTHRNIEIVKMVLRIISEEIGVSEDELHGLIRFVEDRKGHDRRYSIDPSKIEKEAGWRPVVDFEEGLKKTVKWYIEHRQWWERVLTGEYQEYYEKQYGQRIRS